MSRGFRSKRSFFAEFMFDKGLAQVERPRNIRAWIEGRLYKPEYPAYAASSEGNGKAPHAI
ncbi:MAG TPA: hypothetical protein VFV58_37005 [Blastocatellia bacterium]|jgi:hypothetical protein|nr:hypothetical protein [Blastocatellia bacterium]